MNYSDYRFTLDLQKTQSQVSVPVKVGDTAWKLHITFTEGMVPYAFEDGTRAEFIGHRSDGETVLGYCDVVNGKVAVYTFTTQTTEVPGILECEIRLYGKSGELISSPYFLVEVRQRTNVGDDPTPTPTPTPSIDLASDEEILEELIEVRFIYPITDENGAILVDENNTLLLL